MTYYQSLKWFEIRANLLRNSCTEMHCNTNWWTHEGAITTAIERALESTQVSVGGKPDAFADVQGLLSRAVAKGSVDAGKKTLASYLNPVLLILYCTNVVFSVASGRAVDISAVRRMRTHKWFRQERHSLNLPIVLL